MGWLQAGRFNDLHSNQKLIKVGRLQTLLHLFSQTQVGFRGYGLQPAQRWKTTHKSIEKNNFFLFTKKKIQILDAVNKIHNLFPLALIQISQFLRVHSPATPFLPVTQTKVKVFQKSDPRCGVLPSGPLGAGDGCREVGERDSQRAEHPPFCKDLQPVSPSYLTSSNFVL